MKEKINCFFKTVRKLFVTVKRRVMSLWNRAVKLVGTIVIAAVLIAAVIIGGVFVGKSALTNSEETAEAETSGITSSDVERRLTAIGELATYEQTYSGCKEGVDTRKIAGWSIPLTTNSIDISYSGTLKVGFDIEDIEYAVEDEEMKIIIKLPEAQVLSNEIDEENMICNEHNNILNPISTELMPEYLAEIKEEELEAAVEAGIYDKARSHMEMILIETFSELKDYTLEII